MDWKAALLKFNLKPDIRTRSGRWLVMLAAGLVCLILAWPSGRKTSENGQDESSPGQNSQSESTDMGDSYETQLETRLKQLLSQVDGVGQAEVMIVLKESEEKIWRTDITTSISSTQETDQGGGHGRSRAVNSRRIPFYPVLPARECRF